MSKHTTAFSSLVKETISYFRQEGYIYSDEKIAQSQKVSKPTDLSREKPIETFKKSDLPPPIPSSSPIEVTTSSNWQLTSLMPFPIKWDTSFEKFFKKVSLDIPVTLILPEEKDAHRLFLENVSRAITKKFAPSTVSLFTDFEWDAKFTLIPVSLLRKKFPQMTHAHQIYWMKEAGFLAMDDLDHYLIDRNLKLILWQILKTIPFPNMHRSS